MNFYRLSYQLLINLPPVKQHLSPAAEPGGSCSFLGMIMRRDIEQKTSTDNAFIAFRYCVLVVAVLFRFTGENETYRRLRVAM